MTLDNINTWLIKNIDDDLKNHNIISDFYNVIKKYLNDNNIDIYNEESLKYEIYNFFYKNSIH